MAAKILAALETASVGNCGDLNRRIINGLNNPFVCSEIFQVFFPLSWSCYLHSFFLIMFTSSSSLLGLEFAVLQGKYLINNTSPRSLQEKEEEKNMTMTMPAKFLGFCSPLCC